MKPIYSAICLLVSATLVACGTNDSGGQSMQNLQTEQRTIPVDSDKMPNDDNTVSGVYRSTGRLQCQEDSGLTLDTVKEQLIEAGIDVLEAHCAIRTDVMCAAVCGGETGRIYLFHIRTENLPDAEPLGFGNVEELGSYVFIGDRFI